MRTAKQHYRDAWRIERYHWRMKVGQQSPNKTEHAEILRLSLVVPARFCEVAEDQLKERNSYKVTDGWLNRERAKQFFIRKQLRHKKELTKE